MTPLHFASQNDNSDHASIVKVLQIVQVQLDRFYLFSMKLERS